MEAASFEHYVKTGTLLNYGDACAELRRLSAARGDEADGANQGQEVAVELGVDDYILGIFDMTGELMRFAITAMATNGGLPLSSGAKDEEMDVDGEIGKDKRDVLTDLRSLRSKLEALDVGRGSSMSRDIDKKMDVMRNSVEKVERGLYGLVIRGRERPKGWMPDTDVPTRAGREVDVEA